MKRSKAIEITDIVAASKKSGDAQEELVATEAEACMELAGHDVITAGDVKRAIIAMDNIIYHARLLRTKLRRVL